MREFAELARRIDQLERRLANAHREGPVAQVDAAKKRIRLRLGGTDAEPFLSPWVPYAQHAGALKIHSVPSVGQPMQLLSPGGDLRQGRALPLTWSDAEPSPSDDPDKHVLTLGDLRIELQGDRLRLQLGDSEVEVSASQILLRSAKILTDGETRLDLGTRGVVFGGSVDSGGDHNAEASARVFV